MPPVPLKKQIGDDEKNRSIYKNHIIGLPKSRNNIISIYCSNQHEQHDNAYRQFYLGIDFDLTAIKTRSKALKTILFIADMIKLPAPTVEFSTKGTRFHAFYF